MQENCEVRLIQSKRIEQINLKSLLSSCNLIAVFEIFIQYRQTKRAYETSLQVRSLPFRKLGKVLGFILIIVFFLLIITPCLRISSTPPDAPSFLVRGGPRSTTAQLATNSKAAGKTVPSESLPLIMTNLIHVAPTSDGLFKFLTQQQPG